MVKLKNYFLYSFFLLSLNISFSQSVTGTSGLIHIPSARMIEDGQLVLGAAYIPNPYFTFKNRGGSGGNRRINPGLNTYITYGILPFAEVMFRYSHELNMPVNPFNKYFPDRMFSFRLRILKESVFLPSIVFGSHDLGKFATSQGSATNFSTTYVTSNKSFDYRGINLDFTLGYAFDFFTLKAEGLKGVFLGVQFKTEFLSNSSVVVEYDTNYFNIGFKYSPIDSINLMIGSWDLSKPTFSLNYLF